MFTLTSPFKNRAAAAAKDCLRLQTFRCQYIQFGGNVFAVERITAYGRYVCYQVLVSGDTLETATATLNSTERAFRSTQVTAYTNENAMAWMDEQIFGKVN